MMEALNTDMVITVELCKVLANRKNYPKVGVV